MLTADFVQSLIATVQKAGQAILAVKQDFSLNKKQDGSPLTSADLAASKIILDFLEASSPEIPVICEETWQDGDKHPDFDCFWLVDPLDGTKEFIKGFNDYTVNIALIKAGDPIFGIVGQPETQDIWYNFEEKAFKIEASGKEQIIQVRNFNKDFTIVESRSHPGSELQQWKEKNQPAKMIQMGSSLKICVIAEGNADAYPRLGPTMIWDTAAAHAVLRASGGELYDNDNKPLIYNKQMRNPYFLAQSKLSPLRL